MTLTHQKTPKTYHRAQCLGGPLDGCIISPRGPFYLIESRPDTTYHDVAGNGYRQAVGKDGRPLYVWDHLPADAPGQQLP